MKRILITGANGFIGSTLIDHALARGWEVTAGVRPGSNRSNLPEEKIQFLHLHYDNEQALRRELEQAGRFDYVAHIAGTTKALTREDYFRANTDYTRRLVDILRDGSIQPEKFLFLSSLAALGPANGDERIRPHRKPQPVTTYGASKLAAEQYLESLDGFPWVALQPTAVFGPRDKDILEFIQLVNKGFEFYIGSNPQKVSFIYVKDLADMMLAALEHGPAGRKYIAADNRDYTTDDLGRAARESLNRRTLRLRLPMPIVSLVAAAWEILGRWQGKMPPLNREKLHEIGGASWWCDASQTLDELHFTPRYDLFSGIRETVEWYRGKGWI